MPAHVVNLEIILEVLKKIMEKETMNKTNKGKN